jgi:hypothetical protein
MIMQRSMFLGSGRQDRLHSRLLVYIIKNDLDVSGWMLL